MKKIIYLILVSFFVLGLVNFSWAAGMMCDAKIHSAEAQEIETNTEQEEAIDVGNKICPVSGDKINEETKATYEYEGKIYNFCCAMCIDEFKKDPEKYIENIEKELQTKTEEKEMQHHIHKEYHH